MTLSPQTYRHLADALVVFHLGFVAFVVTGGLLVLRWRRVAWLHLPIVTWVIFAECFQRICPLTFLENWLRERGGAAPYQGDFVAHYIMPVLYPKELTPKMQLSFGLIILAANIVLYTIAFRRRHSPIQTPSPAAGGA